MGLLDYLPSAEDVPGLLKQWLAQRAEAVQQGLLAPDPGPRRPGESGYDKLMRNAPAAGLDAALGIAGSIKPAGAAAGLKGTRYKLPMYEGQNEIDVLQNPTRQQAEGFLNRTKYSHARGLVDPATNDVVLWDAAKANHDHVAENLGMDWLKIIENNGRLNIKNPGQLEYLKHYFPAAFAALTGGYGLLGDGEAQAAER